MWYGQCTTGPKAKNCLYNGPAKELTDPKGLKLLNSLCPEFRGQNTCCSTKQLDALSKNLETMAQLTARCPACWNNMRRLYCQLTCNRDQSLYMNPKYVDNSTGHATITDINYYVSPNFKQGLFDSCKDVRFPGNNERMLNLLCGTPAEKCTAEKLLRYMGNTANGFAPFNIYYPESLADKLSWMDITVFKCNKPFIDPQTRKPAPICSCQDCYVPPCQSTTPTLKPTYGPEFRTEQLIIRSTHPSPTGYFRYGDAKWIPFGPIFHLELLNQVIISARFTFKWKHCSCIQLFIKNIVFPNKAENICVNILRVQGMTFVFFIKFDVWKVLR